MNSQTFVFVGQKSGFARWGDIVTQRAGATRAGETMSPQRANHHFWLREAIAQNAANLLTHRLYVICF